MTPPLNCRYELPRQPHYRSLDLWRGVACLLVIIFHATLYAPVHAEPRLASGLIAATKWGWVGVPIFFVISGYCIAASTDGVRLGRIRVRDYFLRRVRRIYPPYLIFIGIAAAVVALVENHMVRGLFADDNHPIHHPATLSAWQWVGSVTLTESWRHYIIGGPQKYFAGHAWTLCYEEQFYMVAGLLVWMVPRRLFAALGALSVAILLFRPVASHFALSDHITGFFFDGSWLLFAAGILVYYQSNYGSRLTTIAARLALIAGIADAVHRPSNVEYTRLVAFSFALLISAMRPRDEWLSHLQIFHPLSWCGRIGYSLYLVHWPVVKAISHGMNLAGITSDFGTLAVTLPICVAASIAVGAVFHFLVETRFISTKRPAIANAPWHPRAERIRFETHHLHDAHTQMADSADAGQLNRSAS